MGFITRIGKGDVSLWYDKWLIQGRICDRIPFIQIHDINWRVKDILQDGMWHFNILGSGTQIPVDIQREMQSIFINDQAEDLLISGHHLLRAYTLLEVQLILGLSKLRPLLMIILFVGIGFGSLRCLRTLNNLCG